MSGGAGQANKSYERYDVTVPDGATAYRTNLSGPDAADISTTLGASFRRDARGRPTLNLTGRFSNASATATVAVVLYDKKGNLLGFHELVLTAHATLVDGSGKYVAEIGLFDLGAAQFYEVRVSAAVSAGNVDLYAWEG